MWLAWLTSIVALAIAVVAMREARTARSAAEPARAQLTAAARPGLAQTPLAGLPVGGGRCHDGMVTVSTPPRFCFHG